MAVVRAEGVPGPRSPLLSMWGFFRGPLPYFEQCAARYGSLFQLFIGDAWVVTTADPAVVRELFALPPRATTAYGGPLLASLLGERAMIAIGGEVHRRDRALLGPCFHGARLRPLRAIIRDAAARSLAQLQEERPIDALDLFRRISLDVIVRAAFGVLEPARVERYHRAVADFAAAISPPILMIQKPPPGVRDVGPWRRFRNARRALTELLDEEIAARRGRNDGDDILSLMVAARDREGGASMDDAALRSELLTLLFAGHETTAISLTWAVYLLLCNPDAHARLVEEIDGLGTRPDPEAILALRDLDAACDETLRLYPVAPWVMRLLVEPVEIGGRRLPAGVGVAASISLVHRNATIYPDPDRFRPERFLTRSYAAHEFFPFGGGNRRCIGAAIAHEELRLVLGTMLANVELRAAGVGEVVPKLRNFTIGPDRPVHVLFRRRVRTRQDGLFA